jgi:RecJ-like exonuclease
MNKKLYPAVAGLADRCDIPELDDLIELANKSREELIEMGRVLDYLSYNFKFDPGDAVYDKVFTNEKFMKTVANQVSEYLQSALKSILPILESKMINGVCFTELDLDKYTQRGKYPTAGKVLGLGHDHIKTRPENENIPVLTAGYYSDGIIFRASQPVLPVPDLLVKLQKELPQANIEGVF